MLIFVFFSYVAGKTSTKSIEKPSEIASIGSWGVCEETIAYRNAMYACACSITSQGSCKTVTWYLWSHSITYYTNHYKDNDFAHIWFIEYLKLKEMGWERNWVRRNNCEIVRGKKKWEYEYVHSEEFCLFIYFIW
jgi:hypothetical protein